MAERVEEARNILERLEETRRESKDGRRTPMMIMIATRAFPPVVRHRSFG